MSNELAIASVTAVLKRTLENGLIERKISRSIGSDVTVTALPPDRISVGSDERPQINMFLYQASPNTSIRNGLGAGGVRDKDGPGRSMALDLYYLFSAYGAHDLEAEILLGFTIGLFIDAPMIKKESFLSTLEALSSSGNGKAASPTLAALAAPGIFDRLESISIVPTFLSTDDMSKLWSALQARFRPSAVYKVSLVIIDGRK